jgi:hypothetical protein
VNPIEQIIDNLENLDDSNLEHYMPKPPAYDPTKDYYREYYRMYLKNENLLSDIDQTGTQNFQMERKIWQIKEFYDNTLIPQMLTQPHKFLHRLKMQQYQIR